MKKFFIIFSVLLSSGCTTPQPQVQGLVQVNSPRATVLKEPAYWISKSTSWMHVDFEQGLLPGPYVASSENALGTFYTGPGHCFYERNLPDGLYGLRKGGFWIPKSVQDKPRFFFVFEPETAIADNLNTAVLATTISSNAALVRKHGGALAQGIGTGIGIGIVAAIIESDRGRLIVLPPLQDTNLAAKLEAAALAALPESSVPASGGQPVSSADNQSAFELPVR